MNGMQWRDNPAGFTRTLQIVVVAMAMGCCAFLAVALFLFLGEDHVASQAVPVYAFIALTLAGLFLRLFAPTSLVAFGRRRIAAEISPTTSPEDIAESLAKLMATQTIVGAAILEGFTFFILVLCLVDPSTMAFCCSAVLIAMMLFSCPTRGGIEAWIADQTRRVEEERSFRG